MRLRGSKVTSPNECEPVSSVQVLNLECMGYKDLFQETVGDSCGMYDCGS